jgi:transcriptional regulator with PAS, ATPase and Fis domain
MAAVWILLSKSNYPKARLVQSSRENGVEYVEMPFDIAAEFIPSKSKDDVRIAALANSAAHDPAFEEIVYRCPSMQKLVNRAQLAATRDVPVLIEGETGTGKELLARAIHNKSSRANAPFVAVNCGAIPRELFEAEIFGYKKGAFTGADAEHVGYFEQGNGGTIFLDELGELPIEGQVKILRVLNDQKIRRLGETKERAINVRIIAATNRSLISEMAAGRFRSDLFYRLAVAVFTLPPLRKREGDLSLLIDSMLQKINHELSQGGGHEDKEFSVSAKNILINHPWPGNAREMFNTITRICVWSTEKKISAEDVTNALLPIEMNNKRDILEKELDDHFNLQETLDFIASHYIERAMDKTHRNKTQAADVLGMSNYQTLNNWIKRLGLDL